MTGQVPLNYITQRTKFQQYIDVTSRTLGSNNDFTLNIQQIDLPENLHYNISVISVRYKNTTLTPAPTVAVYPVFLSNVGKNILVNNTNSSVVFQSNEPLGNTDDKVRDVTNNPNFLLELRSLNELKQISIRVVRSDNGQLVPFPTNDDYAVSVTFLIESI